MKNNKLINEIEDFFLSYWYGKQKLWKAFWLMGVIFQIFLFYSLLFLAYLGLSMGLTWSIKITIFLITNIYTIWILVSIWRCAYNVKNRIWGNLSRVIVVINVILIFLIYADLITLDYSNMSLKGTLEQIEQAP